MSGRGFSLSNVYMESELDPAIHAEILLESSRSEARVAILEILFAIGFGVWLGFGADTFRAVALFCLFTVVPMLVDSTMRRRAARRLMGTGPQPVRPPGTA